MKNIEFDLHIHPASNLFEMNNFAGCGKEPMLRNLKRASAGISLVMLALGFSLLGVLSFLNRWQGELAASSTVEQSYCIAGSAVSVVAGSVFLIAAFVYWRR
jgi:hypothetical protein